MAVPYDYYRIFYYVAQHKSFTKAAEALNNNQPNITRCMNNLEHDLGCKLFVRTNHGVSLTPEGHRYRVVRPARLHVKSTKARKLTATWSANTKATGYQLCYAANKRFTGSKTRPSTVRTARPRSSTAWYAERNTM